MTTPIAETTVPGLTFDPEQHCYHYEGRVVPSVTQVLRPITDRIYRDIPWWQFEFAATRGTHAHTATELDDMGILDEFTLDEELWPYVNAWRAFRADTGFEPGEIEVRLYHPKLHYAGTADRIGLLYGKRIVLDIKTSSTLHPVTGVQLAGYEQAYNAVHGGGAWVKQRWAVQLKNDGTYRLQQYADSADWRVFLGCLQLHQWMEATC